MEKKKIVILGAGFGGIYVSRALRKIARNKSIEITLISRTNYFLFTPLLHEVATGGLSPLSASEPIREILRKTNINFKQAEIEEINLNKKIVNTSIGELPYDILVMSTGAETNFYEVSGAKEYSLTLKTLSDALKIRSRIIDSFEKASSEKDREKRVELLTFVVVGAGATGVELVAELSEFIHDTLLPYYKDTFCEKRDIRIFLISNKKEILPRFSKKLRNWSLQTLTNKRIHVLKEETVIKMDEKSISLSSGASISSSNVFWVAGVSPVLPKIIGDMKIIGTNRIEVDKNLRAVEQSSVFVLGDVSYFETKNKEPLPMFAQVAVKQAKTVANNIKNLINNKPLEVFSYKSKGDLISLGQWQAVSHIFGFNLKGRFAWWIWRTVYLFKFISWKKRFRIMFEWTINLFFPRDTTKIG